MNQGGVDNLGFDGALPSPGGVRGSNYSAADAIYLRTCGEKYRVMWLNPLGAWWHEGAGESTETLDATEGYWVRRGTGATASFTWELPKPYAYPQ